MLATRFATGFVMISGFVAVLVIDEWLFSPWHPAWLLFAAVVLSLTASELVDLLGRTSARPSRNIVLGGVLALTVANFVPHLLDLLVQNSLAATDPRGAAVLNSAYDPAGPIHWLSWPLWTFVAIVMFAFLAQSAQFDKPGGTMATIAGTVLAVAYVGLLGSFIIQLRWVGGPHEGLVAILTLFATAKGADTGAYTVGRAAGRHKLWPRLSPNKTIEGALGGMVFGVGAALLMTAGARELFGVETLGTLAALGFGLVVGAAAQLGDLMESMIKRDCAQKDASAIVPGFGGVLDVADSLLFAGPVAYGYWLLVRP